MNATLFKDMISIDRVMSIYLYFISVGIAIRVTAASGDDLLVVFPFRYPNFCPKIYSTSMVLSLVTGQFGSWFLFIILR